MLIHASRGHYRFLQGIAPYSCGVVADEGWEIVHATLRDPRPWQEGFEQVDAYLRTVDRDRHALCGMELRSPVPFTMQGFIDFNGEYCAILKAWDLYVEQVNPIARTNVAPIIDGPEGVVLHAFSYTVPAPAQCEPTCVVAGAGELVEGTLDDDAIVKRGRTDPEALRAKTEFVLDVMTQRLQGLGIAWDAVTAVDVYTAHPTDPLLRDLLWNRIGTARRHAIRLHLTRPPVIDIEFEMDVRSVAHERII